MSKRSLTPGRLTIRRAVRWTIVLLPVVLLGLSFVFWLQGLAAGWVDKKAGRLLLFALEIAYGVSVSVAAFGALLSGVLMILRRRSGRTGPSLARCFLLCGSLLLAAMVAEAACAVWRIQTHRASAIRVGRLRAESLVASELRIRRRAVDVSLPAEFEDPPGDRDIDLVVLGESTAVGVPFNRWQLSIGSIIKWKLEEAIPGRPIRLNILAAEGDTLEGQQRKLATLRRRPEILVVYCGNAEFTMRLPDSRGFAHYFDERLPGVCDVLVDWIEQCSPVCGLLHENQEELRTATPPHDDRKLVDAPLYTGTEYITLLVDFRRRLERVVSYAEAVGALPILIAPAGNDAGFEPSRSFLPASAPRGERAAFAREFLEAQRMEGTDPDRAMGRFRTLLARQPGFAEAHFRLGKLLERKGEWDEAFRHYVAARDLDGFPQRFFTAFQDVYREVAARHNCILIDVQSYFHLIGRHGLLDDELFQDASHLSLRGQIALAQAVLQALHARRAFGWPKDSAIPFVDPSECAARHNLKPKAWRFVCFWGIMFADLSAGWRYDPSPRRKRQELYGNAADRIEAGAAPESLGLRNIGVPAPIPVELAARAVAGRPPDSGPKAPARFESTPPR